MVWRMHIIASLLACQNAKLHHAGTRMQSMLTVLGSAGCIFWRAEASSRHGPCVKPAAWSAMLHMYVMKLGAKQMARQHPERL